MLFCSGQPLRTWGSIFVCLCRPSYSFMFYQTISVLNWGTEPTCVIRSKTKCVDFKWSIPRPASASRALLRLTPCHRTYRRPSNGEISGIPGSLELTGGEYKTRERIHRSLADLRLLAIPASWGRVAALNPNWRHFSKDWLRVTPSRPVVVAIVLCV